MSGELLFGIHAVEAALTHDPGNVLELYIESDSHNARLKELSDRARDLGVKPHSRPREALDRMSTPFGAIWLMRTIGVRPMVSRMDW